jgi:hypothetical protein
MIWLHPSALGVAAGAAAATVAAHFISRRRPVAEPFPTTRFVPARAIQARVPARAFGDAALLCLRLVAILSLGVAVAAPVPTRHRGASARIVVLDRSSNVASAAELRDSARSVARSGDAIILMDSGAQGANGPLDLARLTTDSTTGSLSAGLAAALAEAASRANAVDSLQIVIASAFAPAEFDAATQPIRNQWPGAIRLVRLRAAIADTGRTLVDVRADSNDAVRAAVELAGLSTSVAGAYAPTVRIARAAVTRADSAWARDSGHVLVEWPRATTDRPQAGTAASDTAAAVGSGDAVLVGLLRRPMRVAGGTPIARWVDGEPAAVEQAWGSGCIREVAIGFDERSDIALRSPFRQLLRRLVRPCGDRVAGGTFASTGAVDALRGRGSATVDARSLAPAADERSPITRWLLLAGALLLILEMAFRRPPRRVAA